MSQKTTRFLFLIYGACSLLSSCRLPDTPMQEVPDQVMQHFQYVGPLPPLLSETSGLAIWDSTLWTHNDSGDGPFLYQVELGGKKLLRQISIRGAGAIDWEDMTQDEKYFYMGDFGNNNGNRKDLCIYEVPLDSIRANTVKKVTNARKIPFTYEDQSRFNYAPYQHNFDCEAMIAIGDSLYLFSKNHENDSCRFYALAKQNEVPAIAQLRGGFDTKGTITGGAYLDRPGGPVLVLLGYNYKSSNTFYPFLWLFTDFTGTHFFSGKHQRINLPPIVQMEGIAFLNDHEVLISSEAENLAFAKLYRFDLTSWLE